MDTMIFCHVCNVEEMIDLGDAEDWRCPKCGMPEISQKCNERAENSEPTCDVMLCCTCSNNKKNECNFKPANFEQITKVEGPLIRHIEQLWDEVKTLKEEIEKLKQPPKDKDGGCQ